MHCNLGQTSPHVCEAYWRTVFFWGIILSQGSWILTFGMYIWRCLPHVAVSCHRRKESSTKLLRKHRNLQAHCILFYNIIVTHTNVTCRQISSTKVRWTSLTFLFCYWNFNTFFKIWNGIFGNNFFLLCSVLYLVWIYDVVVGTESCCEPFFAFADSERQSGSPIWSGQITKSERWTVHRSVQPPCTARTGEIKSARSDLRFQEQGTGNMEVLHSKFQYIVK